MAVGVERMALRQHLEAIGNKIEHYRKFYQRQMQETSHMATPQWWAETHPLAKLSAGDTP